GPDFYSGTNLVKSMSGLTGSASFDNHAWWRWNNTFIIGPFLSHFNETCGEIERGKQKFPEENIFPLQRRLYFGGPKTHEEVYDEFALLARDSLAAAVNSPVHSIPLPPNPERFNLSAEAQTKLAYLLFDYFGIDRDTVDLEVGIGGFDLIIAP